jgi:CNP1-like family
MSIDWRKIGLCAVLAVCANAPLIAWAQLLPTDPDWKESETPAPPALDLKRLIPVEISVHSQLKWGIDPDSLKITPDGIVRYVVVAQSNSGAVNAMYEGLRCSKAEFKTYARYNKDSGWNTVVNSDWKALRDAGSSQHVLRLAKQGLCDGAAPASSVREALLQLRTASQNTGR